VCVCVCALALVCVAVFACYPPCVAVSIENLLGLAPSQSSAAYSVHSWMLGLIELSEV
jgi:hypothetical protein